MRRVISAKIWLIAGMMLVGAIIVIGAVLLPTKGLASFLFDTLAYPTRQPVLSRLG